MFRHPLLVLALLVLLGGFVGPVVAEETAELEAEKQASRERLLRVARRALTGQGRRPNPFASMQRQLADDHKRMMAYEPQSDEETKLLDEFEKTIAERVLLIGWPDSGIEGVSSVGALQEAMRLDQWLAGAESCDVRIRDDKAPDGPWRAYAYPPLPKAEPEPEPEPASPVEGDGLEAPPPSPPPGVDGEETPKEAEPAKEEPPAKEEAPAPPPSIEDWAKEVRRTGEQGTLLGKELSTAVCGVVTALLRAAKQPPAFVHPEVRGLRRHAVVEEDVFAYNAPFVELRHLQADERNKSLQGDRPSPSLVDQSIVDDKQASLDQFAAQLELRRTQRRKVTESLDRMVFDLDEWRAQAALLSREIEQAQEAQAVEEERAKEENRPPTPLSPADEIRLGLARARESLVSLDVTLLYMTALRAERRLALLDRLVRSAAEETSAAEQVKTRYVAALTKLRSERRLDRLYGDQHRLRQWITQLQDRELPEGSVYAARLTAYEAVLAVSGIVVEAVDRRRAMAPGRARLSEGDEDEASSAPEVVEADAEAQRSPLSRVLLTPQKATWDVKYVEIARRELEDPELRSAFDARLIAAHFAAVDDRIRALVAAHRHEMERGDLEERFTRAHAAAEAALEPLLDDEWIVEGRKLPEMLTNISEDFQATTDGIAEQSERNRERLSALVDYRQRLRSQGTRSLLIRTDRDLADRDLRAALRDTKGALDRATRWIAFRDEDHAGGFLQQAWVRLLLALAIVAAAVLGVRYARRRLDVWIEARVAANPILRRAGASLREEQDEAKRRREEEDQAKPEVTAEEVLQQVVETPVEPPPEGEEEAEDEVGTKGPAR